MQKAVGGDRDDEPPLPAHYPRRPHRAHGRPAPTRGGTERRKVVPAPHAPEPLRHRTLVERLGNMPRVPATEWIGRDPPVDHVRVALAASGPPRIEVGQRFPRAEHADRRRQESIERPGEGSRRDG